MPRIRSNNNISSAAAVVDTAAVATQQRGPLHTASQGPLSPAVGVVDTSIAAASRRRVAVPDTASVARRVTVSDTVTVVVPLPLPPSCLKKTLKYSSRPSKAQVQSTLRAIAKEDDWNALQQNVASATALMEQQDKELFDKVTRVYKFSNKRGPLEKALEHYAAGKKQEWDAQWQVVWADYKDESTYLEQRREQVKAHYEDLETVLAEADNSTPKVSFSSATVKEYVLTEWERVHIKLGEARRKHQLLYELPWVPRTKYDSFAPVPSQSIKRGGTSAYVKDHLDDYSKRQLLLATREWLRHGNIEALALHQQPLPRSYFIATATAVFDTAVQSTQAAVVIDTTAAARATQSTQANVIDTSIALPSTVVTDTTATAVLDTASTPTPTPTPTAPQSTESAITDMAVPQIRQQQSTESAITDMALQSTPTPSGVVDTSMVPPPVTVTATVRQSSTESAIPDMAVRVPTRGVRVQVRRRRRRAPMAAAATSSEQPLRRSRRIAGLDAETTTCRRSSRIAQKAPVCYKKFF